MTDSNNTPTGRPDFVLPDGSAVDLKLSKLNPDAEKALRKLLLEVWSFYARIEDSSMTTEDFDEALDASAPTVTQKFCNLYSDLDEVAYRGLRLLGFDCWEDLEADVWAKKPEEVSA